MSPEIQLREITQGLMDSRMIVDWRNANARWFPKQESWTIEGQQMWYREVYRHDPSQNLYFVCVNYKPIGIVGMTISHGTGELERMILGDKDYARGGYMRAGMRQLMASYGLAQYWLRVMPDNEATISFHKSNGFSILHKDGEWYENTLGERGQYIIMTRSYDGYWPKVGE